MKQYQISELFQHNNRTLMCVEVKNTSCDKCSLQYDSYCGEVSCDSFRSDNKSIYFTNKLIFQSSGIKLQVKRKGSKVKVKVLELSEDFEGIGDLIWSANYFTCINRRDIGVHAVGDKKKRTFDSDQEAIDWVDRLFSLRME